MIACFGLSPGWGQPAPEAGDQNEPAAAAEPRVVLESAWIVAGPEGERIHPGIDRPAEAVEQLYTARFRYEGASPAAGLRIVLPVPAGADYVADSATGPGAVIQCSVDGGQSFAPPGELRVAIDPAEAEAGSRTAQPEEYTHLRWDLPGEFAPGVSGLVSFRVRPATEMAEMVGTEEGP